VNGGLLGRLVEESSGTLKQVSKRFFFEKKNQKTSDSFVSGLFGFGGAIHQFNSLGCQMPIEPFTLVIEEHFSQASIDARPSEETPLSILIKDDATGAILGGLTGQSSRDWMFVKLLFVPERLRGQNLGTKLLDQAESIARARHCVGIWLDTFEFQARGFYEKRGYEVFGEIADYPKGFSRFFLQKRFDE
jgi:GNAT superfamily N-acetyltransferase